MMRRPSTDFPLLTTALSRLAATLFISALVAWPVFAQGDSAAKPRPDSKPAARAASPEPVRVKGPSRLARAYDRVQPGERWYGVYIGHRNVGHMRLRVERRGQRVIISTVSRIMGESRDSRADYEIGRRVRLKTFDVGVRSAARHSIIRITRLRRNSYRFSTRTFAGGESRGARKDMVIAPDTLAGNGFLFFAPGLEWADTPRMTIRRLDDNGRVLRDSFRALSLADIRQHGRVVRTLRVDVLRSRDKGRPFLGFTHFVSSGGVVRTIGRPFPLTFVLGTARQARANLPATREPRVRRVAGVVERFYKGVFQNAGLLDGILDYGAVHKRLSDMNPNIAVVSPEMFRSNLRDMFSRGQAQGEYAPLMRRYGPVLSAVMSFEFRDGRAVGRMPPGLSGSGDTGAIHLKRGPDGGWRVIWWEGFRKFAR